MRSLTAGLLFCVALYKVPHDVPRPWDVVVLAVVGALLLWSSEIK